MRATDCLRGVRRKPAGEGVAKPAAFGDDRSVKLNKSSAPEAEEAAVKRILPLIAVVVALVGCAKPSVTPTDGQASAKADPQAGEPKPKSDNAEPTSKPR